jgi:prolyl 4-hydroxylase
MKNLSDYVKVYDNVLGESLCFELINLFIGSSQFHEKVDNHGRPKFTQVNYSKYLANHSSFATLIKSFKEYIEIYQKDVRVGDYQFPNTYAFEEFRMKRYRPEENERFDLHTDVGDHRSAKRFLAFFFYLNDVEDGGETVFPTLDISIKPKAGRLLIFPPLWMFPHSGMMPVSNSKYIIGSYLHYL